MFRRLSLAIALSFSITAVVSGMGSGRVAAGGAGGILVVSASPSYAVVNHSLTISVYAYYNSCSSGAAYGTASTCSDGTPYTRVAETNQVISVAASGTATLGGVQTYSDGVAYVTTGASGTATFTVTSAAAGDITVTAALDHVQPDSAPDPYTTVVTFANPSTASTTPATTPKKTTATSPTPAPPTTATAPDIPKPTAFKVAGQPVENMREFSFQSNQALTLQGTAIPKGIVKLYIFSTERQATVAADAQGNWSYEVKDLEAGKHHVEVEVTDPVTNATSIRSTLAAFTVVAPPSPFAPSSHPLYWEATGGVLLVILVIIYAKVHIPKPPKVEKAPAYTSSNATGIYPGYESKPVKQVPPDIVPEEKSTSTDDQPPKTPR